MNHRELAELCLKILACYSLLTAINQFGLPFITLVSAAQNLEDVSNALSDRFLIGTIIFPSIVAFLLC